MNAKVGESTEPGSSNLFENNSGEEQEIRDDLSTSSVQCLAEVRRFSYQEDCNILKYIQEHKIYPYLKGIAAWKKMAEYFGNNRTYGSLKSRFRTCILSKIDFYIKNLNFEGDDAAMLRQLKTEMYPKHLVSPIKFQRRPYSPEDDKTLLNYIFNVQRPFPHKLPISGNLYWRMAAEKLNKTHEFNRTWQSIKGRFKKVLVLNLCNHDFYTSKHRSIAQHCFTGFDKQNLTENMKKFEAKRLQNRKKRQLEDSDSYSTNSDEEADTLFDIIKDFHTNSSTFDVKIEKEEVSSDDMAASPISLTTKKRRKKTHKKVELSKKSCVNRSEPKLKPLTENQENNIAILPLQASSSTSQSSNSSLVNNNDICDNDSANGAVPTHPHVDITTKVTFDPPSFSSDSEYCTGVEVDSDLEFEITDNANINSNSEFNFKPASEPAEIQPQLKFLKQSEFTALLEDCLKHSEINPTTQTMFIKQNCSRLNDLNCQTQERVLISRILQPAIRSRVGLKSNRRYIV